MMHRPTSARPVRPTRTMARTCAVLAVSLLIAAGAVAGSPASTPAWPAASAGDTLRVALVAPALEFDPGDTFTVDLVIPEAGPSFNAYDAYVAYDPEVLTFLQASNIVDQEGPLMREACFQTFHLFEVAPDSSYLEIHHVLLCANTSLTGPGVIYRLRFEARDVDADTELQLLLDAPTPTRFFDDGLFVTPLATVDAAIRIGEGTVTTTPPAAAPLELRAAPNPFNPRTTLAFALDAPAVVDLQIYDLAGRHVRTLERGARTAGAHAVRWDGRDDAGGEVPTGVYLVRLRAGARTAAERLTLVR